MSTLEKKSKEQKPKLTILTALFSFDEDLLKTFNSLKKDLHDGKIRWIIKSSNPTSSIDLSNFKGFEKSIFFVAEKDSSLYEGLNSGLKLISTEFFLVLGSGDCLLPGAAEFIINKISDNLSLDGFMFPVNYEDYIYPTVLESAHFRMPCSHQGAILNTEKTLSLGGFDLKYKYAADYDLLSRYISKFPKILTSSFIICNNKPGGISDINKFQTVLELYLSAHNHWHSKYKDFEFNETVLQNLSNTNERIKNKKIKKEKGEIMQTPSELRQEIFSYLLNIENERKNDDRIKYENLTQSIQQIFKALEEAHKDFLDLKSKIQTNENIINPNIYKQVEENEISHNKEKLYNTFDNSSDPLMQKIDNVKLEKAFNGNEKLKSLFGFKN
jgi:hypothetical protein